MSLCLCRLIGKVLKYPLLDTDALIEQSTSRTVAEIFEQEGEESFRELETSVLKVRRVKAEAHSEHISRAHLLWKNIILVKGHSRVVDGEHNARASCVFNSLLTLPSLAVELLPASLCRS